MDHKNQVVVITGASNGIGKQLALDLAARGAVVVGCGRSIARLKETLKEVRRTSPSSIMIGCDVSDAEQVQGMIAKIIADYGKIDVLVNNAGIGMASRSSRQLRNHRGNIPDQLSRAVYCAHAACRR